MLGLLLKLRLDFVDVLGAVVADQGEVGPQHRLVAREPGIRQLESVKQVKMSSKPD